MSQNKVLFSKDIMEDIISTQAGDSETVYLRQYGSNRLCVQAVYDVQAPSAKTFDSGGAEIDTFTFDTFANTGDGDYLVIYDTDGNGWAAAADKTGTSPEPTGAVWAAIPAGRKVQVDISAAVSAADVATAFEAGLNGLTDFPYTAADATADVVCTGQVYGAVTAPEVYNEDDSGNGSITAAVTDAGVNSEVNVVDNELTIPSHAYPTGLQVVLTTTGTLPAPLQLLTTYYVIAVDANTIKLAATLVDAIAGTAINITDQGSDEAVNTVTPASLSGASVTFQVSNDGTNWTNYQSATSITVDGSVLLQIPDVSFLYFKAVKALTAGIVDLQVLTVVRGDDI